MDKDAYENYISPVSVYGIPEVNLSDVQLNTEMEWLREHQKNIGRDGERGLQIQARIDRVVGEMTLRYMVNRAANIEDIEEPPKPLPEPPKEKEDIIKFPRWRK